MAVLDHEEVVIRTGARSGLPVIVAVHSTALGQAVGGCRLWQYDSWQDGMADALRLSAGMTSKCAVAGLANGGGKTVIAVPPGLTLEPTRRQDALRDAGDVIAALDGRYATGPDAGTGPEDMAVISERTRHVFCRPPEQGGSGACSPRTATGVLAAVRAACAHLYGTAELTGRRITVVGLGHVGEPLARLLGAAAADLTLSDISPAKRALADQLGATWADPGQALTADADILIPAALGGMLTEDAVPRLRCAANAGPANNQLASPHIADLLHKRGIIWVPDYVASAGGVIYALAVELHRGTRHDAIDRVLAIGAAVTTLLDTSARTGQPPARTALELAQHRLTAAAGHGSG